jgi:hypothetical protein
VGEADRSSGRLKQASWAISTCRPVRRRAEIDYRNYRTTITLTGEKPKDNYRQETDTISRLVYGFASPTC